MKSRTDILAELRLVFEYKGNPVTPFGVNTPSAGPGGWAPLVSFPFRTKVAEAVWAKIPKIIEKNPDQTIDEIIRYATIEAGTHTYEMTPEDIKLLELAVAWSKSRQPESARSRPKTTV